MAVHSRTSCPTSTVYIGMCLLASKRLSKKNVNQGHVPGAVALAREYVDQPVFIIFVDTIFDADLSQVTEFKDGTPHPGKDRTSGYFGFAGHNDPVMFRNIAIKEIK